MRHQSPDRSPRSARTARATTLGLASTLVAGGLAATGPSTIPAHAAPAAPSTAPASSPRAQQAITPGHTRLAVPSVHRTVTVDGQQRTVVAALSTTRTFTMAGLTWASRTGSQVLQLRVRTAAGWQAWQTLDAEPSGASASEGGRQGTDLAWYGPSTAVEVRVLATGSATLHDLRLSLIDSRASQADGSLATAAQQVRSAALTTTGVAQPTITSRAAWGANEKLLTTNGTGCVTPTIDRTILAATVHHTEGTNNYSASQSAAIVRGIYAFHVQDRGWCDIGYDFLVDKYGQVFEGRHGGITLPVHGAHATYWNTNTLGISVMMNSMTAQPSSAAMNSLANVIAWKLAGNYRDPNSTLVLAGKTVNRIFRHGDVMSTDCPGTYITRYMPTLRRQVTTKMGNWKTPIYTEWQSQGGETGTLGSPHVLERPFNGGRTTTFTGGGIFQGTAGTTHWMDLATNNRYLLAGSFAALGWPTSDQQQDTTAGRSFVRFQKGSIYHWSKGTFITTGAVDAWLKANPTKFAALGYPTSQAVADSTTTGHQTFANGRLDWNGSRVTMTLTSSAKGFGDQDGRAGADLVQVSAAGQVTWYPSSGTTSGVGVAGSKLTGAPFTWVSQLPDNNGDGHSELVARRRDGTLWAWQGLGNGRYTGIRKVGNGWNSLRELTVVPSTSSTATIYGISTVTGALVRYHLDPDWGFRGTLTAATGWKGITHIASAGDVRGAGVDDVLAVDNTGKLWDYAGSTTGALNGSRTLAGTYWNTYSALHSPGDIDGDGHYDLVAQQSTGPLYLYRGLANGRWASRTVLKPDATALKTLA